MKHLAVFLLAGAINVDSELSLIQTEECKNLEKSAYALCRNEASADGGYQCYVEVLKEAGCLKPVYKGKVYRL